MTAQTPAGRVCEEFSGELYNSEQEAGPDGVLSAFVWPAYIAFAKAAGEHVPAEYRGQITWTQEAPGRIVGYANALTLPGDYPYVHYYQHPYGNANPDMIGQFDQPMRWHGGIKHIAPICFDGTIMTAQV